MALSQEVELRILRKMMKSFFRREKFAFSEARRVIGKYSQEIGEKTEDVAEIVGTIYKEAVSEVFEADNFKKKGH